MPRKEGDWPGFFAVFEGNDGAGKSLQVARVGAYAAEAGIDTVVTKEPGGIPQTVEIRRLILDPRNAEDGETQLELFAVDRRLHLKFQVIPALKRGALVVCDRFSDSTGAYQEERGIQRGDIRMLDHFQ